MTHPSPLPPHPSSLPPHPSSLPPHPSSLPPHPSSFRPYPSYKASGVEWLGEVPEGWEVKKITWLYGIGSGTTPTSDNTSYYDGEIPWITTGELRENIIVDSEKKVTQIAVDEHPSLRIYPKGSLVIAYSGPKRSQILVNADHELRPCRSRPRPGSVDKTGRRWITTNK